MNETNMQKLYGNLLNANVGFNRTYDEFVSDMQDEEKRKRLHGNLSKAIPGFTRTYDEFSADMGLPIGEQQSEQEQENESRQSWIGRKAENIWNATKSGLLRVGKQLSTFADMTAPSQYGGTTSAGWEHLPEEYKQRALLPYQERVELAQRVQNGKGVDEATKKVGSDILATEKIGDKQQEAASKARRDVGEDAGFVDLIKSGNIGGAMELGLITAMESAPQMLAGHNPVGMVALGTLSAADEYDRLTKERPEMSESAKAAQAIFHGAIEQLWEQWGNPLKVGKAKVGGEITHQIEDWVKKDWRQKLKSAGKGIGEWAKEMTDEGMEEVMTDLSNMIFDTLLGAADKNAEGLIKEYQEQAAAAAQDGEELTKGQFAWDKAKGLIDSFLGGAMAGGYMGAGSMAVNKAAGHRARTRVENEDGTTRRMNKYEREMMLKRAEAMNQVVSDIAEKSGLTRKEVLERMDKEREAQRVSSNEVERNSYGFLNRLNEGLANYSMRQNAQTGWMDIVNSDSKAIDVPVYENDKTKIYRVIVDNLHLNDDGTIDTEQSGNIKVSDLSAQEFVQADGVRQSVLDRLNNSLRKESNGKPKEGSPASSPSAPQDDAKQSGTPGKPKRVSQQRIRIELDGKPVDVRYTVSKAVWNDDGSLNTEKSSKVLLFPNDPKGAYGATFGNRTEKAVEALQEALRKQQAEKAVEDKRAEQKKAISEQQEQASAIETQEMAEEVTQPPQPAEETPQGEVHAENGETGIESAPKPYPTKEDGTPDFEQIGSDPDMSVAAARDMGLDESVLIDNSVARIDEEIATTQKSKKMSVLEQMARVDALEKKKSRWENLRKKEENAENPTESLDNQKENSNFADEGGQQNDNGRIQGQSPAGSGENVELGRQGQGVHGGGTQENTPAGSNEMRVGGGSLPDVSITDQLDEQNPQYTVDMDKVEKFEGENDYGDMMEHRDKELEKEKQQPKTEQKEEKPQKKQKTDLRGNDIVLLYSPTRQEYVWARKETDGNGNTKYYRVDTGRPFRANVDEGYKGEDGKWVFDKTYKTRQTVKTYQNPHGELKEFETTAYVNLTNKFGGNRIVYLKNGDTYTPYMLQSPFSLDELKNGKTASGRTIGQKIVLMPLQTYGNVVDGKQSATYRLYVENENREKVPLTKGQENHTGSIEVQSPNEALETVLFENNKAGIRITLADILATPIYTQKRKKTVKDKNGVEHKEDTSGTTQTQVLTTIKLQLQKQFSKLRNDELVAAGDAEMAAKEIQTTLGKIVKGWNEMVEERGLDKLLDEYKDNLDLTTYNKTFSNPTEISLHIPQEGNTAALIKNIKVVMDLAGKLQEELELDDRTNDYLFEEGVYPQVNLDFVRIGSRNEIPTLKKKTTKTKDETATPEQQDKTGATEQKPTAYRIPNSDDIAKLDHLQDQIDRAEYDGRYDDYVEAVKQYNELYDTFDFSNEKEETRPQRVVEKSQWQFMDDSMSFQRGGTVARAVTPAQRFVTNVVMKALGRIKGITIHRATQEDVQRVLERIKNGESNAEMMALNDRFNEKLGTLSEENADSQIFDLGYPSPVLLAAGVQDNPLKLYGNKIIKKAKEHGYSITELRNLPEAVANPIAVFNNYQQDGSRSILTELKTADGNFLVTLTVGKGGVDIDFNIISSIFGKTESSVVNWIEKGYATYLNKEKTLEYLHFPAPIAAAANTQELNDVAKVVQNFENPKFQQQKNANEQIETFETPDGTVYGWAVGNEIYLTEDGLNPETPIHEYTHLWAKAMENSDPKGWAKIVRLCKGNKALWDSVQNDPNYANIKDNDSRIASEVLSRYAGKHGMERLVQEAEKMAKDGKSFESDVESKLFVSRMKNALKSFWGWVKEKLGIENLDDISNRSLHDLLNETDLGLEEMGLTTEEKRIAEQAKADGTYMQAPNGKPSNLSPKQWLQTRTEAFKEWFGDWEDGSQNKGMLLDENGEPKVVYRGSANDDFVFRSRYGEGTYWFTDNREVAEHYARRGADHELMDYELDGRVQPVFLKLGDSSTYNAEGRNWEHVYTEPVYQIIDEESGDITAEFKTREEAERYCEENGLDPEIEIYESNGVTGDIAAQQFADGKTGVVFENVVDGGNVPSNVYVVRDNGQAKSATENNGGFDEGNPDIRFQIESGEIGRIDEAVERRMKTLSDEYKMAQYDPKVKMPEKLGLLNRLAAATLDRTEGIRILLNRMDEVRQAMGLTKVNRDKYDVRALLEQSEAATAGRQKLLDDRQVKDLRRCLHGKRGNGGLVDAVKKSELYQRYKTEKYTDANGNVKTVALTPEAFIDRYLIARDTIERMEMGIPPRGIAEFTQRMGVDMVTFVREVQDSFSIKQLTELHNCIKAITDVSIDALHDAGMLTDEQYSIYKSRKFYVPEKGFEAQNSEELSRNAWERFKDYVEDKVIGDKSQNFLPRGGKQSVRPLATSYRARGGDSMATDVMAHIIQDTYDAIEKAELNKVKRAMYDLLRENPEVTRALNLPIPKEVYYVKNEAGEWVSKSDGVTAEEKAEARAIMSQVHILEAEIAKTTDEQTKNALYDEIDALLEAMPYADEYTTKNVWQTKRDENLESVGVWVNGVLQEMRFPNMEQVANALNNRINTKGSLGVIRKVNGIIAGTCTQYNPSFFAVNLVRDIPFILAKGSSEYGYEFAARFGQELLRPTNHVAICQYMNGNLDESKGGIHQDFYDFITGGGQTGYARSKDIEELRKMVDGWKFIDKVGMRQLVEFAPKLNEWSELCTRFSAYRAALDCGMSKEEALKAAKNLSVNFNRRGFGGPICNALSSVSMFANASIQGACGFYRTFGGNVSSKKNSKGKRVARAITNFVALPAIVGAILTWFTPDDDDKEKKIPDWERDNYICIGDSRFALNEQIKPFYLIGVNAVLLAQGRRTWGQVVASMSKAIALNLLPVPPVVSQSINLGIEMVDGTRDDVRWETVMRNLWMPQGLQNFNAIAEGKDFMGRDLRKDYGDIPEYRMGENEAIMYQDLAYIGYRLGKGREDMYSTYKKNGDKIDYNRNPKEIKNNIFFTLAPQGWVDIAQSVWGIGHAIATGDSIKESVRPKDIPIVNRFYKPTSVEMYRYGIYKQVRNELQEYKDRMSNAKRQAQGGNASAAMEIDKLNAEKLAKDVGMIEDVMKIYTQIDIYQQAKRNGMSEKELKKLLPEGMEGTDEERRACIQVMRQWLIDTKGVRAMMDDEGRIVIRTK